VTACTSFGPRLSNFMISAIMLLIECDIVHLRRSTLVTTETFSTSNGASHLDDVLGYQLRCIRDPFNHISSVKRLRGVSTVQEPRTSTHCMCMQNFNKRKERFLHFFLFRSPAIMMIWAFVLLYIVRMSIHIDVTIQPICIGMTHSTWCFTSATCEWSLPTDLPILGLVSCCTTQSFARRSSL